MKSFSDYLNEFKELKGFTTDKELGEHFGVTGNYITNARRAGNFSDERCIEIAHGIDVPEYEVVISRNMLKETGPMHEVWEKAAKRLGGMLAIGAVMIGSSALTAEKTMSEGLFTEQAPAIKITGNYARTTNFYYRK